MDHDLAVVENFVPHSCGRQNHGIDGLWWHLCGTCRSESEMRPLSQLRARMPQEWAAAPATDTGHIHSQSEMQRGII